MRIALTIVGILLVIGIIVPLSFSGVQEYQRVSAIDREIAKLQSDVDGLERRNAQLEERIAYFSSDVYKEQVAKEQLGYRKVGEHVAIVAPGGTTSDDGAGRLSGSTLPPATDDGFVARVLKWWQRFVTASDR